MFEPAYWRDRDLVTATASGRGTVSFVSSGDESWVVRPYRRGGLIGRLIQRSYLYLGVERSRSFRELRLLGAMHSRGLPVPKPVAALCQHRGLFYSACIIIETIPHQQTLWQLIEDRMTSTEHAIQDEQPFLDTLTAVGRCLKQFHASGVWHADLNAHNVLLAEGNRVSLIDFDRGHLANESLMGTRAAAGNLERFKRSVSKCLHSIPQPASNTLLSVHEPEDKLAIVWAALRDGYQS